MRKSKFLMLMVWVTVVFGMTLCLVQRSYAANCPNYYSTTGHCYVPVLVPGGITWDNAKAAAESVGGYLATVTSAGENDFVYSLVSGNSTFWNTKYGPWLGGYQPEGSPEPNGGWTWVTGEPWSYTNWESGEPNNYANIEHVLHYSNDNQWNDASSSRPNIYGYIIEFDNDTCTPPPSGMVSWWRGQNNANDSAGTNHGNLMNGATFAAGKVGQAFSFDGVNDYVSVPDSSSLQAISNSFSISAWVKPETLPSGAYSYYDTGIVARENVLSGFALGTIGNKFAFIIGTGSDLVPVLSDTISTGNWYYVVGTYNASEAKIYVNGILIGTRTITIRNFNKSLDIGHGNGRYFKGLVDEVAIVNRALTAEEIAAIYNAGSAGKCVQHTLTVAKQGTGSGTVTSSDGGIDCGADCTEDYSSGTSVTLTATPASGSTFAGWSGDADCSDGQVTMNADKTCTATFNLIQRTLTVTKAGTGTGTVTGGANCTLNWVGSTGTCTVNDGTVITLSGTADTGSTFTGWSEGTGSASGCTGTGNCSFNITANSGVTATFALHATPFAPSNLHAVAVSPQAIMLTWNDNSNNETGLRLKEKQEIVPQLINGLK